MTVLLCVLAMVVIMSEWSMIRDAHNQWRWKIDPYYPRNGAPNGEVLRWWLASWKF